MPVFFNICIITEIKKDFMQKYILTCAMALIICSDVMAAATPYVCRRPEYAEIKDFSKKELAEKYCEYSKNSQANQELFQANLDASDTLGKAYIASAEVYSNASVNCLEIMGDFSKILKKRYKATPPPACRPK